MAGRDCLVVTFPHPQSTHSAKGGKVQGELSGMTTVHGLHLLAALRCTGRGLLPR